MNIDCDHFIREYQSIHMSWIPHAVVLMTCMYKCINVAIYTCTILARNSNFY